MAALALAAALLLAGCGGHTDNDAPKVQLKEQRMAASANSASTDVSIDAPYANFSISGGGGGDSYTLTDNVGNAGSQTYARGVRLHFTDATVELDTMGTAAQTYRLYQAAFNRQPDLAGLGYWINAVDSGASMLDVANGFIRSQEFADLYGGANPTPQTLVTKLYANVLHRAPDPGGFQYWLNALASGATPAQVLSQFSESPENQAQVATQVAYGVVYYPVNMPGVYLLAGDGISGGNNDGVGAQASFDGPNGLVIDGAGNLYTSDTGSNRVRKITPQGQVSTLVGGSVLPGTIDGPGATARFSNPIAITADGAGNMYVLDNGGTLVRKVTPTGVVSSYAGCFPMTGSTNCDPQHAQLPGQSRTIVADKTGGLYVAGQQGIVRIDSAGVLTTFFGYNGNPNVQNPSLPYFRNISGMALDGLGNLYVADTGSATILKSTPSGSWTVVAGASGQPGSADGNAATGRLQAPTAMAFDSDGTLYIVDASAIRKLSPAGNLSTVAGVLWGAADGPALTARFWRPNGIVVDAAHNVYIADTNNNAIRELSSDGVVHTVAGNLPADASIDGNAAQARFTEIGSLAVNSAGTIIVVDRTSIREISSANQVSTLSLTEFNQYTGTTVNNPSLGPICGIAVDAANNIFFCNPNSLYIYKITPAGLVSFYTPLSSGPTNLGMQNWLNGMAIDSQGRLFVADSGNSVVHEWIPGSGNGPTYFTAPFYPSDVALDLAGNMYIANPYANAVFSAPAASSNFVALANPNAVTGYADGSASAASFNEPSALAVDPAGNVYVADTANHLIRKITPDGTVTTVAGTREQSGTKPGSLPGVLYRPSAIKVIGMKTLIVTSGANIIKIVLP